MTSKVLFVSKVSSEYLFAFHYNICRRRVQNGLLQHSECEGLIVISSLRSIFVNVRQVQTVCCLCRLIV